MFDTDLIFQARWDQLYAFFADGNPPLALQLLLLNTIFMAFFFFRRATTKYHMRKNTAYFVQGLLIATNVLIMFQHDVISFANMAKGMARF